MAHRYEMYTFVARQRKLQLLLLYYMKEKVGFVSSRFEIRKKGFT